MSVRDSVWRHIKIESITHYYVRRSNFNPLEASNLRVLGSTTSFELFCTYSRVGSLWV